MGEDGAGGEEAGRSPGGQPEGHKESLTVDMGGGIPVGPLRRVSITPTGSGGGGFRRVGPGGGP